MRSVIIILFTLSQSIAELQILITSFSLYAILPQREYVPNSDLILDTPRFLFKRVTKGILKLIAKRVPWKESVIRNFDETRWRTIISVREDDGVSLLQDNLGLPSIRMCDPTLLLTKNDYLSTLRIHHPDNDRISSYILDSNSSKDDMLKIVASFFKNDVLPLGYSEDNGVSSINDWVRHLVSSKFLITDSFHGTLFAINSYVLRVNLNCLVIKRLHHLP